MWQRAFIPRDRSCRRSVYSRSDRCGFSRNDVHAAIPSYRGGGSLPASRKDALNDGDNRLVPARYLRNAGRFGVHGADVTKQVTHFPVTDNVKVGERKEQGLAYPEGCQALNVYPTDLASWAFHCTGSLSHRSLPRLIQIG
jgi:hypothetical protein